MTAPSPRPMVAELPRYSTVSDVTKMRWKASSNESTRPPTAQVIQAITDASVSGHLYPSLTSDVLAGEIADRLGLSQLEVVVGGGSISVLQQALLTYCRAGDDVVHAWRTYEAYPILIAVAGAESRAVSLTAEFGHDLPGMIEAISAATRVVMVCNPNNPTGTEIDPLEFERFLAQIPEDVLVVLDEAYFEFGTRRIDGARLIRDHRNVAVFRTFSKAYALAGLRVGYMLAHADIASAVRATSLPFGVSAPAEAAARQAWSDPSRIEPLVRLVDDGRKFLRDGLLEFGIESPESYSNFVWLPLRDRSVDFARHCLQRGVSVRAFDQEGVRITVGDRGAENAVLAAAADFIVDERSRSKNAVKR